MAALRSLRPVKQTFHSWFMESVSIKNMDEATRTVCSGVVDDDEVPCLSRRKAAISRKPVIVFAKGAHYVCLNRFGLCFLSSASRCGLADCNMMVAPIHPRPHQMSHARINTVKRISEVLPLHLMDIHGHLQRQRRALKSMKITVIVVCAILTAWHRVTRYPLGPVMNRLAVIQTKRKRYNTGTATSFRNQVIC